ncbi:MAG: LysM peptidoglycan-binding domain-containing protein [Actinobacteria bacterium]|nr:LysM peptidoglycan-binding domain-containing protein [Actinomycetota bacterium]
MRPSQAVYRRRRLGVLLCAAAVFAAGFGLLKGGGLHQLTGVPGGGPLTAAGQPVSALNVRLATDVTMIVQPGDTLWTLARRAQPTGDVRPLVQSLEARRHGRMLMVGERVTVALRK